MKQEVAAAMQQLTQAEAVELLQLLAVRDYTRDSPVLRSYSDDADYED